MFVAGSKVKDERSNKYPGSRTIQVKVIIGVFWYGAFDQSASFIVEIQPIRGI
jgi:hypothetical protein